MASYRDFVSQPMPPGTYTEPGMVLPQSYRDAIQSGRLGMGDLLMAERLMPPNPWAPNPYDSGITNYMAPMTAAEMAEGQTVPPWVPYLPAAPGTLVNTRPNWEAGSRDLMGTPLPPPYPDYPYPRLPVPAPAPYANETMTPMLPEATRSAIRNIAMPGTLGAVMGGTALTQRIPMGRDRYEGMIGVPTPAPVTPFEQDPSRVYPESTTGPIGVMRGANYAERLPLARDRYPGMTLPETKAPAGKARKFKKVKLARDRD